MKVTTAVSDSYTTIPREIRLAAIKGIQAERPWSDLDPEDVTDAAYEATANGCLDVYIHTDDDKLAAVAHIAVVSDLHVGEMVAVYAAYVWPEYRKTNAMRLILRTAVEAAKREGIRWCGYSHWSSPMVHESRYIDLHRRIYNV